MAQSGEFGLLEDVEPGRDLHLVADVHVAVERQRLAVLVLVRPLAAALHREPQDAIRRLQAENIAPVDFAQAAIGPGMAVSLRYARALEADGRPIKRRAALAKINRVLDETLAEGETDAETRFCVA